MSDSLSEQYRKAAAVAAAGGPEKYHDKLAEQGKLFVRERVDLLCDAGSFVEDGLLANAVEPELAADADVEFLQHHGSVAAVEAHINEVVNAVNIQYAGEALRSGQRCFWKVRAWDQEDEPSAWSAPAVTRCTSEERLNFVAVYVP